MRLFPFIDFVIPKEGTFVTIENFCIPKTCAKQDLVYTFLRYLYTEASMESHFKTFGFFPATFRHNREHLDARSVTLLEDAEVNFGNYHFFKNSIAPDKVRDILVEVKTTY